MIYVGTCGYAYRDWIGPFYPAKIKPSEMLGYYAQRFRAVEIDASYYGVPAVTTIAGMNARTPSDFRFSFKAPQTVTHAPDLQAARVHDDARLLRERLEPMREAGKLAAVLLQFPNGFQPSVANEAYLRAAVGAFAGVPLVVEFRHRRWQDAATLTLLRELRAGWSNVDMPAHEALLAPSSDATSDVGYVRFHGRNAAQWWTGNNVTRYAYDYVPDELIPWADRLAEIDEQVETVYAFFNNHAFGSAARDASLLEALLEDRYGAGAPVNLARPSTTAPTQDALPGLQT
ncbi:MAG TPA: DUF72 domain-containing protein [Verrucomicrobiae bacterium]|nr:DUF72 domain-containing protein [Verrucomicrobiae bacterium]